jgi:hypothetical protein
MTPTQHILGFVINLCDDVLVRKDICDWWLLNCEPQSSYHLGFIYLSYWDFYVIIDQVWHVKCMPYQPLSLESTKNYKRHLDKWITCVKKLYLHMFNYESPHMSKSQPNLT